MPGFMRCGASDVVHASWRQAPAMGAYLPDSLNLDLNMFPKYYFAKMRNSDFNISLCTELYSVFFLLCKIILLVILNSNNFARKIWNTTIKTYVKHSRAVSSF